ncbi:MAG: deoxyribonuclease IV [Gemmatimonadaceae bacterium]
MTPAKKTVPQKAAAKKAPAKKAVGSQQSPAIGAAPTVSNLGAKKSAKVGAEPIRMDAGDCTKDRAPLGAHVSVAGGSWFAAERCREISSTGSQIFTKNANRWIERDIESAEASQYKSEMANTSVRWTCAHDSYLINLASPDETLRARSIQSFRGELRRCHALGLHALVSHPGNFIDDRDAGISRNLAGIIDALEAEQGPTRLLLELTAGQGTVLGSTFEEMAAMLNALPQNLSNRVGVCLDTAHVWAAGYDLINDFDGVFQKFDDTIGLDRLECLHLNDSKAKLGSHLDRHDLIGEGSLGAEPFRRIMTHDRLSLVPKVIETPKGDDFPATDARMLSRLRSYAAGL